jgi:hypothetical protein
MGDPETRIRDGRGDCWAKKIYWACCITTVKVAMSEHINRHREAKMRLHPFEATVEGAIEHATGKGENDRLVGRHEEARDVIVRVVGASESQAP